MLDLALRTPWLLRAFMTGGAVPARRWTERLFAGARALASPADRAILERPEIAACLMAGMKEAFRQGGLGPADELMLLDTAVDVSPGGHPGPGAPLAR